MLLTMESTSQLARDVAWLLDRSPGDRAIGEAPQLHGFGGLHGGLLLARMVTLASAEAPGWRPRAVTGHFHRPAMERLALGVEVTRRGRMLTSLTVQAIGGRGLTADAVVLLAADRGAANPIVISPPAPDVPSPEVLERFEVPREFVPIADQTEIRPIGPNRPFAGGNQPELLAWIRIVGDDAAPDIPRLTFLLDALAPAHSAVLRDPAAMPTVQLAANFGSEPAATDSAWVLLRATSTAADAAGWLQEDLDAWSSSGIHLASARQIRMLM
jgi:hypothetical protein